MSQSKVLLGESHVMQLIIGKFSNFIDINSGRHYRVLYMERLVLAKCMYLLLPCTLFAILIYSYVIYNSKLFIVVNSV